jgi:hypothetical protein
MIKIYKTIILRVLYGYETWSLALREGRRLKVYGNRVLRIILVFEPKRRKWWEAGEDYNDGLHNLYALANIIRVIKSRRMNVAHMRKMRNAFEISVWKPEGKRQFGRTMYGWKSKINMNFREVGWERADWMHLAQDRGPSWALVNIVMYFSVSIKTGNF